jgi:hypothetical protein
MSASGIIEHITAREHNFSDILSLEKAFVAILAATAWVMILGISTI